MRTTKRKVIVVPKEARKEICELVGFKESSLSFALHFKSHSAKAMKARELAITKFGGVETEKVVFS